jgi:leukotriene-A4 hydrolase
MSFIRTLLTNLTRTKQSMHRAPATMVKRPIGNVAIHAPRDPNTLSNYNAWRTQHITANLEIDFAKKRLFGNVVLRLKSLEGENGEVVLDSRYVQDFCRSCLLSVTFL